MAKKSSQKRLTIPFDLWEFAKFYQFDLHDFAFFVLNDSRVIIMPVTSNQASKLECIGKCTFDYKHRFFIPKNVDVFLGEGNEYYFSTELSLPEACSHIFLYKIDKVAQAEMQNYHYNKFLESLN